MAAGHTTILHFALCILTFGGIMTLIYFLIVIGILVFVHELGHFIMAKRAGVRVEKFSLGMGPKLFGYKKGDTEYVISAFSLGGYAKMAGQNPDEETTGS